VKRSGMYPAVSIEICAPRNHLDVTVEFVTAPSPGQQPAERPPSPPGAATETFTVD
jgi:hypothetical protein